MRKAPSVASSWLSGMSTLITCTGWKVSCSLEVRSGNQQKKRKRLNNQTVKEKLKFQTNNFGDKNMTTVEFKAVKVSHFCVRPHLLVLGHRPSPHRWSPGQTGPCSLESALAWIWCVCFCPACAGHRFVCIWGTAEVKEQSRSDRSISWDTHTLTHHTIRNCVHEQGPGNGLQVCRLTNWQWVV